MIRKRKNVRQTINFHSAAGDQSAPRVGSNTAVAPDGWNRDAFSEDSTAASRQIASDHQASIHRSVRATAASTFGRSWSGTRPDRVIEPTNAVMCGPIDDSKKKKRGMATSRRTCRPTTLRANR
jgi:hypothetical protein